MITKRFSGLLVLGEDTTPPVGTASPLTDPVLELIEEVEEVEDVEDVEGAEEVDDDVEVVGGV